MEVETEWQKITNHGWIPTKSILTFGNGQIIQEVQIKLKEKYEYV